MNSTIRTLIGFLALLFASAALPERIVLDDSLSPQQNFSIDLKMHPHEIAGALAAMAVDEDAPLPPLTGHVPGVVVRLNTERFVGQRVRVFMSLPGAIARDSTGGELELSWQNRGEFLSGSIRPGQEAVIFEGLVENPVIGSTFDFTLTIESNSMSHSFAIEPEYELEVLL